MTDTTSSLNHCPKCDGPADNGHDRCFPPNPYYCTKCSEEIDQANGGRSEISVFKRVQDEKAYALAVHLKGFEAHIAGKENAKQFRDEMRMLLDMIKSPPYLSTPEPVMSKQVTPGEGQSIDRSTGEPTPAPGTPIQPVGSCREEFEKWATINLYKLTRDHYNQAAQEAWEAAWKTKPTMRELGIETKAIAIDFEPSPTLVTFEVPDGTSWGLGKYRIAPVIEGDQS